MRAVWADIDHDEGRSLIAVLDSVAEETGGVRYLLEIRTSVSAPVPA